MKGFALFVVLGVITLRLLHHGPACLMSCEDPTPAQVVMVVSDRGGDVADETTNAAPPAGDVKIRDGKRRVLQIIPRVRGEHRTVITPVPPEPPLAPQPPLAPSAPAAPPSLMDIKMETAPAWFKNESISGTPTMGFNGHYTVKGRQSITEQRALDDARAQLESMIADWIRPEVPRTWHVPRRFVDSMIQARYVQPVEHEYGLTYKAGLRVHLTPQLREKVVSAYYRQQGIERMGILGGLLVFVLACLAALSGYIRADEATKGYYTNRLRLVAAAGVGTAGFAIYRILS